MVLVLPIPPSQNHAYVNYKNGRRGLSGLGKRWRRDAKMTVMAALKKDGIKAPLDGPVLLNTTFYWPNYRRRDVDNALKLVMDALVGTMLKDDCWTVVPLQMIYSTRDRDDPRVELFIRDFKDLDDCPGAEKPSRASIPTEGRGKPFTDGNDGDFGDTHGDTHRDNQRAA